MQDTYNKIAEKAYYNYLNKGAVDGNDLNDWLDAEQEVGRELETTKKPKRTRKKSTAKKKKHPTRIKAEFYFNVCDGGTLKNVKELKKALKTMSEDVFYFHVNESKNDFANWIKDIFKMEELAQELYKARTMEETKNILKKMAG